MQSNALKVRNFLYIGNPVANLKKKNFPRMCLLNKKNQDQRGSNCYPEQLKIEIYNL